MIVRSLPTGIARSLCLAISTGQTGSEPGPTTGEHRSGIHRREERRTSEGVLASHPGARVREAANALMISASTALLVLLKHEQGTFEKFALPTGQHLWGQLMLPAEFGWPARSTHQNKHDLCFEFGGKCSSLCHREPPSWF
ncbi:MAG TPA: hypothetical protein VEI53_14595 [Ktedonobacteraceae bacterium]|nr:hypothetical protein [Ktedonobacteraceae bacterium]